MLGKEELQKEVLDAASIVFDFLRVMLPQIMIAIAACRPDEELAKWLTRHILAAMGLPTYHRHGKFDVE